eukprot:TRINITY_DN12058_c0_g1_i1.p1 TRINITY_DN12058_c0_g1~~TRINITY_DN12058_c0_g1_i1.p1  ORF type:complete len:108 (-),score=9.97 TRINITY_DN12058_c0_g1_i1:356-679(-)
MTCPGCHASGRMLNRFEDGFHDGDFWFHCNRCGEEGCVDYSGDDTLDGKRPPTKQPPYQDNDPLPINCPASVGTPSSMRWWAQQNPGLAEYKKKAEPKQSAPAVKKK